ncbi:MAG: IS110 family transposase [Aestuariivirgaceae bacterium]
MSQSSIKCAGIDVSKKSLDIAVHASTERFMESNDAAGHARIIARLKRLAVTRIGVEASGHYEAKLVRTLRQAGFEVLVLDPGQVHGFRRFRNQRAKTDPIDAALIAAVTAACETVKPAPDERLASLAEHLTLIEQIGEDIARLKVRRERFDDKALLRYLNGEIARLSKRRKAQIARLTAKLLRHADLQRRFDLLLSIPAIGQMLALTLVIRMPELGHINRAEAAALAGVAPFNNDSGPHTGERHIQGGRHRVRRMAYLAAFTGSRWNPVLQQLYQRLTAAGKHHKLAITACARKLLEIANAILARGAPWRPALT